MVARPPAAALLPLPATGRGWRTKCVRGGLGLLDFDSLYARHAADLEDFWGRRDNQPECVRDLRVFGWPVRLTANQPGVLAAAD